MPHLKNKELRCTLAMWGVRHFVEHALDAKLLSQPLKSALATRSWEETRHSIFPAGIGEVDDGFANSNSHAVVYTEVQTYEGEEGESETIAVPVRRSVGNEIVWNAWPRIVGINSIQH